jgi:uncharacterized repeat protein (TIGR03809 family)
MAKNHREEGGDLARRWRRLAERRRQHLVELYRTGRWRQYFSEEDFLRHVRQASEDVEAWDGLASEQSSACQHAS